MTLQLTSGWIANLRLGKIIDRGLRGRKLKSTLVALVLVPALVAPPVLAKSTPPVKPRLLPMIRIGEIVVEPVYRHLFLSTGADDIEHEDANVIVVTDFDGRVVKVFRGLPRVHRLLLAGSDLYAAVIGASSIVRIDVENLRIEEQIDVSPYPPTSGLALVQGRLWFVSDCYTYQAQVQLVSVDLLTGMIRTHPQIELDGCPHLAAIPSEQGSLLLKGYDGPLRKYDVTTGEPILIQEREAPSTLTLVVDPNGESIYAQTGTRYRRLRKLSAADLTEEASRPMEEHAWDMEVSASGDYLSQSFSGPKTVLQVLSTSDLTSRYTMNAGSRDSMRATGVLPSGKKVFGASYDFDTGRIALYSYIPSFNVRARSRIWEFDPAVVENGLAWSQNTRERPRRVDAYLQEGKRRRVVNAPGTDGLVGNVDGSTLVYTEIKPRNVDVMFYDLETHKRRRPPVRINTRAIEWKPVLSKPWLFFVRTRRGDLRGGQLVLVNIETGAKRIVARGDRRVFMLADDVEGRYAVWTRCKSHCEVRRYDIETGRNVLLDAGKVHEWGASLAPDGTAYVATSARRCGKETEIVRYPLQGRPVTVVALRGGMDIDSTEVAKHSADNTRVLYTPRSCRNYRPDIVRFDDARI